MNRMTKRTLTLSNASFKVREEENVLRIEGYFAVFGSEYNIWPGASESVDPHAFDSALQDDVRALIDHETRLVLGRTVAGTLELRVDDHGLWGSVIINPEDQDAMNLYARVKRGDVSQCSFGFDILDEEAAYREDGTVHWTIKSVKLYEVSVCTFPAYRETEVQARRADYDVLRKRRSDVRKNQLLARLRAAGGKEE